MVYICTVFMTVPEQILEEQLQLLQSAGEREKKRVAFKMESRKLDAVARVFTLSTGEAESGRSPSQPGPQGKLQDSQGYTLKKQKTVS